MSNYTKSTVCILTLVFAAVAVYAQPAWQFGRAGSGVGEAWSVATDGLGNFFAAGVGEGGPAIFDTVTVTPLAAIEPCVWVKYNSAGAALWGGGTTYGNASLTDIAADSSGNLIVYGHFNGDSMRIGTTTLVNAIDPATSQYFLAKISPTGTLLWAIRDGAPSYGPADVFSSSTYKFGSVTTDDSGNIYIAGAFKKRYMNIGSFTLSNNDTTSATADIFVAKYSPSGVVQWATSAGGIGNEFAFGVTVTPPGDVYVAGSLRSASVTFGPSTITDVYYLGKPLAYVARFSPAGIPLWAEAAGGSNGATSIDIKHDNYGNVYVAGYFMDTSITFGTATYTRIVPALTPTFASFLVKLSPANVPVWGKTMSSGAAVRVFSAATSSCGTVWVSGTAGDGTVIDTGYTIPYTGGTDPMFIAGYDLSGAVVGYDGLTSGGDDNSDIACDAADNVYFCGDFESTVTVGPDVFTGAPLTEEFFVAKYGSIPDTTYTHTDTTVCGTSLALPVPAGYNIFLWDDGETTPTRTITSPGTYRAFATACSGACLSDTFHVSLAPDSSYAHYDTAVCVYSDFGAFVTLTAPGGGTNYLWFNGTTTVADTVSSAGAYWISYKSGCTVESDTIHLSLNFPPLPITGPAGLCSGDSITFNDATAGGIWVSSAPGVATIDSTSGLAYGSSAGTAVISYIATTGCYTTATVSVTPPPCPERVQSVPANADVSIYPNPAGNEITIACPPGDLQEVTVINYLGEVIMQQHITGATSVIYTARLPQGIYLLRLTRADGFVTMRKLVKE